MSWRTRRYPLTKDQKSRGVVYSSQLVVLNNPSIENGVIHEVHKDDPDRHTMIRNLEDVSFFKNMAREMGWNVINYVHR